MAFPDNGVILSGYDEVLKNFYLPAIQEQLNHDTILADIIDTNEEDISGKNATIEMHYGRTRGTGEVPRCRGARGDRRPRPRAQGSAPRCHRAASRKTRGR